MAVSSGDGWSLQAGVRIRAGDRGGLERLCRYVMRPPLAEDRMEVIATIDEPGVARKILRAVMASAPPP